MPRAGYASIDNAAFAKRPKLMGAKVGKCANLFAIPEHGDAFATRGHDNFGGFVRDREWGSDGDPACVAQGGAFIDASLAPTGYQMQQDDGASSADQHERYERTLLLILQRSE